MPSSMWPTPPTRAAPIPSSTAPSLNGMVSDSGSSDGAFLSSSLALASIWGPLEPSSRHLTSTPTKQHHHSLHHPKAAGMAVMDASSTSCRRQTAQQGWPNLNLHATSPNTLTPGSHDEYWQYPREEQLQPRHWDSSMASPFHHEGPSAADQIQSVSFPTPLHAHSAKQSKPVPLLALADILRESISSQSSASGFPHPLPSSSPPDASLYSSMAPNYYSSAPVTPITDSFTFHAHTHVHSNTQHPHLPLANRASQRAAIALMLQNRVDMTTICQLAGGPDLVLDVINANPTEFASKLPELHATLRARAVSSLARGESGVDVNDMTAAATTTPTRASFGFDVEENRRRSMTPVAQRRIANLGTPVKNQHASSQLVNGSLFPHTALEASYPDLTIAIERPSSAPLPCGVPGSGGKKGTAEKSKMRGQFVDLTTSSGSVSVTSSPVAAAKRQSTTEPSSAVAETKRASPPSKLKLNLAAAPFHSRSREGTGGTGISKEVPSSPVDGAFARNIVPVTVVKQAASRPGMETTTATSSAETFAASVAAHVGNRLVAAQQEALRTLDDDSWDEYYYQTPPRSNKHGILRNSKAGVLHEEQEGTLSYRVNTQISKPSPMAVRTLLRPNRSASATRQTDSPTPCNNGNADGPLARDDIVRIQSVSFTHAFNAGKLRMFLHSHKDLKHFATFDYVCIPEDAFNAFMGDTEAIWSFRFVTRPNSSSAAAGSAPSGTCAGSSGRVRTGLVLNASGQTWEFSAKEFLPAGSKALTLGDWVCMQPLDSFVMRLPKAQVDLRFNVVEFNGLVRLQKVVVPPTMSINVKSMGLGLDGNLYWVPEDTHMVAGALVPRFGLDRLEPQMVTIVPRGQGGVWKKW